MDWVYDGKYELDISLLATSFEQQVLDVVILSWEQIKQGFAGQFFYTDMNGRDRGMEKMTMKVLNQKIGSIQSREAGWILKNIDKEEKNEWQQGWARVATRDRDHCDQVHDYIIGHIIKSDERDTMVTFN